MGATNIISNRTLEMLKTTILEVRVEAASDFNEKGLILANCIKKIEENPELSAKAALAQAIADEAGDDVEMAALLGVALAGYVGVLNSAHEGKYIDISVVHVDNGEPGPSYAQAKALRDMLSSVLGRNRVSISGSIEGGKSEKLYKSILDGAQKVKDQQRAALRQEMEERGDKDKNKRIPPA